MVFVGTNELLKDWDVFEDDIVANNVLLLTSGIKQDGSVQSFSASTPVQEWMQFLTENYTWSFIIDSIKENHKKNISSKKKETILSLDVGPSFLRTYYSDSYTPNAFNRYDLSISKRVKNRWFVNIGFNVSFNMPNARNVMQEQIQS